MTDAQRDAFRDVLTLYAKDPVLVLNTPGVSLGDVSKDSANDIIRHGGELDVLKDKTPVFAGSPFLFHLLTRHINQWHLRNKPEELARHTTYSPEEAADMMQGWINSVDAGNYIAGTNYKTKNLRDENGVGHYYAFMEPVVRTNNEGSTAGNKIPIIVPRFRNGVIYPMTLYPGTVADFEASIRNMPTSRSRRRTILPSTDRLYNKAFGLNINGIKENDLEDYKEFHEYVKRKDKQ